MRFTFEVWRKPKAQGKCGVFMYQLHEQEVSELVSKLAVKKGDLKTKDVYTCALRKITP